MYVYILFLSLTHTQTHKNEDNLSISNLTMNAKSLHNFFLLLFNITETGHCERKFSEMGGL